MATTTTHQHDAAQTIRHTSDNGASEASLLVAILGLPKHSVLTLDGCPIRLETDDFVGFTMATNDDAKNEFHWLTVRPFLTKPKSSNQSINNQEPYSSIAVGFWIPTTATSQNDDELLPLILQYNPQTEEVQAIQESKKDNAMAQMTRQNLLRQYDNREIHPTRLLPYHQVVNSQDKRLSWSQATRFVSQQLLYHRNIYEGHKIVPGLYQEEDHEMEATEHHEGNNSNNNNNKNIILDGTCAQFPAGTPVFWKKSTSTLHPHRITSHLGTKQFLSGLSATQRTAVLMADHSADEAWALLLLQRPEYRDDNNHQVLHWQRVLGDVQLAYFLFLQLQCVDALAHWRDMTACLASFSPNLMSQNVPLYNHLLQVLQQQLQQQKQDTADHDLFENSEDDNFLRPSIQQLVQSLKQVSNTKRSSVQDDGQLALLQRSLGFFESMLQNEFPSLAMFSGDDDGGSRGSGADATNQVASALRQPTDSPNQHQEMGKIAMECDNGNKNDMPLGRGNWEHDDDYDAMDDDEDGPVIVPLQDVEDSMARITTQDQQQSTRAATAPPPHINYPPKIRSRYPILFAAVLPHEDVLMTCARALDDKRDVSLVREAADYLEQVEAKSQTK